MEFIAHTLKQGKQLIFSTTLKLKDIFENSEVLVYEKDPYGYQRPIDLNHAKKIRDKALKIKEGEAIFPTSIILGISEGDIDKQYIELAEKNNSDLVKVDLDERQNLFRIIDGQHRIIGLSQAAQIDKELWEFPLNVSILIIPFDKRYIELDVFEDINSTAKKLKTDLILLARQQYVILGERSLEEKNEAEDYIAIKTSYLLNEKIEESVWQNAIKFEKNFNSKLGIIGVAAFSKAIKPLVKQQCSLTNQADFKDIFKLNQMAENLADYINKAWEIVYGKWEVCFSESFIEIDDEKYITKYNSNYYLQKTTGVNAITSLLLEKGNLVDFADTIANSKLQGEEWIKGGKMAGLTSGSGFKKAIELIKK